MQLQNVRFCRLHFQPEHIQVSAQNKLTIDAIPLLNLLSAGARFLRKSSKKQNPVDSEVNRLTIDCAILNHSQARQAGCN